MDAASLRARFLEFFVERAHLLHEPASLIPAGDPSVLFTTAGMQQFKPYYLGVETPPSPRITTCQRSFRTSDIENVGRTARHLTFFEMLGNFAFGDYFKEEAIAWALELSAELGLERERIWVSVFGGDEQVPADEESIAIWKRHGFPDEKIIRLPRSENFWGPAGPTGPCGPCSELYYDNGPEVGCGRPDCAPGCDCDRFLEYWNLVFTEFDMDEKGDLSPLPSKNIDTGMGLERIAAVTQGVVSVYETDLFRPLIELGEELSGVSVDSSEQTRRALRTMAEHARGVAFLVMDGVTPSNEGRGYVLRRVIRRAVQQGVGIGLQEPFLARLCERAVEMFHEAYPGLGAASSAILEVARDEETRFRRTLEQGMGILDEALRRARDSGQELPAEVAFELHDTYGFPFDLTREIAEDHGMHVDEGRFERLMEEQRERARTAQRTGERAGVQAEIDAFQRRTAGRPATFVGYERLEVFTVIRGLQELSDGRHALKLEESPFYAEGGGQVADRGWIHTESGKLDVDDVVRFDTDQVVVARLQEGALAEGERAKAMVNAVRRHETAANHTATHLLHNALRVVLGEGVRQAGSLVAPDRLRFDYTTRQAPTPDQLRQIEALVNRRIVENHPVRPFVTTREYATEIGAIAFFEEKYGDYVRVLEIDDFSRELCGGTHVAWTSEIGLCKVTHSSSVGANTRRIEAVTSTKAIEYFRGLEDQVSALAEQLGVRPDGVPAAVRRQVAQFEELKEKLRAAESGARLDRAAAAVEAAETVGGLPVVAFSPPAESPDELLAIADQVRERLPDATVILATEVDGKVPVVVSVGDGAVGRGVHAQEILKAMLPPIAGKGGGKPNLARGAGSRAEGVAEAVAAGAAVVRRTLGA
jgi:alanyl-tRNA synthetase